MSDNVIIWICAISFFLGCITEHKIMMYLIKKKPRKPLDYVQTMAIIDELNYNKNRLRAIERLLTDSECCTSDLQREIKCLWGAAWESEDERERNKYTFTIDSNDNYFTHIATVERKKIKAAIARDVDRLSLLRAPYGVTHSVTQTQRNFSGGGANNG